MSTKTSLKAMAADPTDPQVKKNDLWKIDPLRLEEEEGFNLRDYDDPDVIKQIEAFAEAYQDGRYVPPLIVRVGDDGRVLMVEGHLRRRGARLCIDRGGILPFVDCVQFKGSDVERVEVMLRSADGLQLKPLAIALGYLRLERKGCTKAEIAKAVNRTVARVEQLLLLATANADVHALVREGKVSADGAIEAVRVHGEKAGDYLANLLQSGVKATRQGMRGAGIPPKVATNVTEAFSSIFDKRSRVLEGLAHWEKSGMQKGQKIEVDAEILFALKEAHDALTNIQAKREERDASRAAKANQQNLDGVDE